MSKYVARHHAPLYVLSRLTMLQTRAFAALLFRRISSKARKLDNGQTVDLFLAISKDQAAVIRQKLLETLGAETNRAVRNKIGDAVAEIARQYSENGEPPWPPLPFTFYAQEINDSQAITGQKSSRLCSSWHKPPRPTNAKPPTVSLLRRLTLSAWTKLMPSLPPSRRDSKTTLSM